MAMYWAWHNVSCMTRTVESRHHTMASLCIVSISFLHKHSERQCVQNRKGIHFVSRQTRTRTLASLLAGLRLKPLRNWVTTSVSVSTIMSTSGSCKNKHWLFSSLNGRLSLNVYHRRKIERDRSVLESEWLERGRECRGISSITMQTEHCPCHKKIIISKTSCQLRWFWMASIPCINEILSTFKKQNWK